MSSPTPAEVMAAVAALRSELRAEIAALEAEVAVLRERLAAQERAQEAEIDADTLVMLAAAVTSYLGKRVRIRSARLVHPADAVTPAWAREGRAALQSSHELPRGH